MVVGIDHSLTKYDVSPRYGFLPDSSPLQRLSDEYYEPWESVMDRLPQMIAARIIRAEIDGLPVLGTAKLSSREQWRRAYVVLSFLTHAYIWGDLQPSQRLPPSLCCPFLDVSDYFDLPRTATYSGVNLWNFAPRFADADLTLPENLRTLQTFTGTADEEWFYLISVSIEAEGAKIIPIMLECFDAIALDRPSLTAHLLGLAGRSISRLGAILDRMYERCDPEVFYHRLRPFLAGSKGMAAAGLPHGVFYDEGSGVGAWQQYSGGSNAQSSLIQLLDAMLGVGHSAAGNTKLASESSASYAKQGYLKEMRRYMPASHRAFLEHVINIANIREYATKLEADIEVQNAYRMAVDSLTSFRDKHIQIVSRYIIIPSRSVSTKKTSSINIATVSVQRPGAALSSSPLCGTGGTNLVSFLKQTRDETKQASGSSVSNTTENRDSRFAAQAF